MAYHFKVDFVIAHERRLLRNFQTIQVVHVGSIEAHGCSLCFRGLQHRKLRYKLRHLLGCHRPPVPFNLRPNNVNTKTTLACSKTMAYNHPSIPATSPWCFYELFGDPKDRMIRCRVADSQPVADCCASPIESEAQGIQQREV